MNKKKIVLILILILANLAVYWLVSNFGHHKEIEDQIEVIEADIEINYWKQDSLQMKLDESRLEDEEFERIKAQNEKLKRKLHEKHKKDIESYHSLDELERIKYFESWSIPEDEHGDGDYEADRSG